MHPSDSHHSVHDTVFYRWQDVLVSERWFSESGHWYPVGELRQVTCRPGPIHVARRRASWVIGPTTALISLSLMVALPPPVAVLGAGLCVMVAAAAVWLARGRWPRPMLLCARYRGLPVVLFASTDHIEFRKLCRAMRRAVEWREDGLLASGSLTDERVA